MELNLEDSIDHLIGSQRINVFHGNWWCYSAIRCRGAAVLAKLEEVSHYIKS